MTAAHNPSESVTTTPTPAGSAAPAPKSTAVQVGVPTAPPEKKKRKRAPWTVPGLTATLGRLDRAVVALVLALAFLLGAFAIHNNDYWLHLATGRALVQGDYRPGQPAFADVPDGTTWVNHSWLFDLLLYLLHQVAGDPGVVVVKALGLVLLACLLLAIRRPHQSLVLPAVGTTLAVVVLSISFDAQSRALSLVLLAATLYLLLRPGSAAVPAAPGKEGAAGTAARPVDRHLWLLPPLFALWANLDAWFVLGPLVVLLMLVGEAVQSRLAPEAKPRLKKLGLVLLVGVAACLATPYLLQGFTLPTELAYFLAPVLPGGVTANGQAVHTVHQYQPNVYTTLSPFTEVYWTRPAYRNAAGFMFFALFGLSLLSFVLAAFAIKGAGTAGRGLSWPLMMLWWPFALLAALQVSLIPFFAVVAGPVLALNLQDFVRHRYGTAVRVERSWPSGLLGGRQLALIGLLLLLFLAWPGWLHSFPDDSRRSHRVAFRAAGDPLWPEAAARLDELQATGKLRNGFTFNGDAVGPLAWNGKRAGKSFFDERFGLFTGNAEAFGKVRRALRDEGDAFAANKPLPPNSRSMKEIHEVFRKHDINYVVLSKLRDYEMDRIFLRLLIEDDFQWPLLYMDGHTAVFGWRDPKVAGADPFRALRPDYNRQAFGPVDAAHQAPPDGLADEPQPPHWWVRYWKGLPGEAPTAAIVQQYANYFKLRSQPLWRYPYREAWAIACLAGPVSTVGTTSLLPATFTGMPLWCVVKADKLYSWVAIRQDNFRMPLTTPVVAPVDAGPPALPILAVRAGRRAVAAAPQDGKSHLAMAKAVDLLWVNQEESWARQTMFVHGPGQGPRLLTRPNLRFIQLASSLNFAARLEPTNLQVRERLAQLYQQKGYLDLALEHVTDARNHLDAGTATLVAPGMWERQRKFYEGWQKTLEVRVKQRHDEFKLQETPRMKVVERFMLAVVAPTKEMFRWSKDPVLVERGLAKFGLDLLKKVDFDKLSAAEKEDPRAMMIHIQWRLWLLLVTGEIKEMTKDLSDVKQALPPDTYEQFRTLAAAALGDYRQAEESLAAQEALIKLPAGARSATEVWGQLRRDYLAGYAALMIGGQRGTAGLHVRHHSLDPLTLARVRPQLAEELNKVGFVADARLMRGLLALEQGDTARGKTLLEDALRLFGPAFEFPERPMALRYVDLLTKAKKE
jgi:hypothetical protein